MDTTSWIYALAFALSGMALTGCCPNETGCPDHLTYLIPYTLYPTKDTFQLGDTLWLEFDFEDKLADEVAGVVNHFENVDFEFEWQSDRIDTIPLGSKGPFDKLVEITGAAEPASSDTSGFSALYIFPVISDHFYHFKCRFVLKQRGVFVAVLNAPDDDSYNQSVIPHSVCHCTPANYDSKLNEGDPDQNNYYLVKNSPVPAYANMTKERFGRGLYAFVVE